MVAALPFDLRREHGQGLVEYALIIGLVAMVVIGALTIFGSQSNGIFSHILATLSTAMPWG